MSSGGEDSPPLSLSHTHTHIHTHTHTHSTHVVQVCVPYVRAGVRACVRACVRALRAGGRARMIYVCAAVVCE